MLHVYSNKTHNFDTPEVGRLTLTPDMIWLDIEQPTPEEEQILEKQLGFDLPTREELKDIEPSSRLYHENGVAYMTASIVWKADVNEPEIIPVAFILSENRLITIRYEEPKPFVGFRVYAAKHPEICATNTCMLGGLLEAISDRLAEIMEKTGADIDGLSKRIFAGKKSGGKRPSGQVLEDALGEINLYQNMASKARDSLVSLARMVGFLATSPAAQGDFTERLKSIGNDIKFLTDHVGLLSNNITFLLEASLGLVNIEQNAIIKIFSVAAVVFLPPTLVASIYGMNFHAMPELSWQFGYPFAILMMIASAVLPYWWFKQKGWL